jgi:Putative adhesin
MRKKIIEKLSLGIAAAILLIAFSTPSPSQETPVQPPEKAPVPSRGPIGRPPALAPTVNHDTTERSLKVDSNVNLGLCVTQGTVTINSWKRNELRVFVHDGSKFTFKELQKNEKTGDPVWVTVVAIGGRNKTAPPGDCITGGDIDIDVPTNTTIKFKGQETNTTIDSVRKANVWTAGGDISLRNISEGIMASTYEGDITVEESKGSISLESSTGNILVFEAGPSDIGDTFKAKTNGGMISLQKVEHRQIDVTSISGSVAYNGAILSGGSYAVTTSNGSIRMSIPQNSACTVSATYGYGRFETELPIKISTENVQEGPVKTVVGTLGAGGDAILKLTSNNGSIAIKKQ